MMVAVDETVSAMRDAGRLTPMDAGLVAAVQGLVMAVDKFPNRASLWKEMLSALGQLAAAGGDGEPDDLATLLAELQSSVADPPAAGT